jgi:flavin-dependent dehydrogenase
MCLDAVLAAEASQAGAELIEGFRVCGTRLENGTVCGVEGVKDGTRLVLSARLVVVADGARSALAHGLGTAREPRWPARVGLVAHFSRAARVDDGFGQMHVSEQGYCGVVPLPMSNAGEARQNVAMVLPPETLKRSRMPASVYFDHWIAARTRLRDFLAGCNRVTGVRGIAPVGSRCTRPFAAGALVVGDAAGFFDPFTGEGIYRALCSAELAADVGRQALQTGDVSERTLSAYGRERARVFRRKSAVTALVQLFVQCPPLLDYAISRLNRREDALETLGRVLGDIADAGDFLRPAMLWRALRP